MTGTKIEKERKWLIKKIPPFIEDEITELNIEQFYTSDGWRYRRTCDEDGDYSYCKMQKIPIERGLSHEVNVTDVTEEEYEEQKVECDRIICKDRFVYEENGKKYEFDIFDDVDLAILEIEDVDMNESITFPEWLEKYILIEVTGNPLFSNYSLAENNLEVEF